MHTHTDDQPTYDNIVEFGYRVGPDKAKRKLFGGLRATKDTKRWIGMVVGVDKAGKSWVLTIGTLPSKERAYRWCEDALDMMHAQRRVDVQPADMYDFAAH